MNTNQIKTYDFIETGLGIELEDYKIQSKIVSGKFQFYNDKLLLFVTIKRNGSFEAELYPKLPLIDGIKKITELKVLSLFFKLFNNAEIIKEV